MDVSHWGDQVVVIGDDGRALFLDLTARYCAIRLELQSPLQVRSLDACLSVRGLRISMPAPLCVRVRGSMC
eukprot:48917-Eustigmatos_ZCMA.PRE.1